MNKSGEICAMFRWDTMGRLELGLLIGQLFTGYWFKAVVVLLLYLGNAGRVWGADGRRARGSGSG